MYTRSIMTCVTTITSVWLLTGCYPQKNIKPLPVDTLAPITGIDTKTSDEAQISEENINNKNFIPDDINHALMPPSPMAHNIADVKIEPHFNVSARQMEAQSFFLDLVSDSDYNIIVHPEVQGLISLSQKNTTIPQVLDIMRMLYGYDYSFNGINIEVMPATIQTRTYIINYLNLLREGTSQIKVSAGTVSQQVGGSESGSGEAGTVSSVDSGSSISTISGIDFWNHLAESVFTIIGNGPQREVTVNPATGMLIVKGMPGELKQVENFLRQTEDLLHRQVIIEAKILEVKLTDSYQAGIDWAAVADDSILAGQIGSGETLKGEGLNSEVNPSTLLGKRGNINPDNYSAINNTAIEGFGGIFSMAISFANFSAFIELLEAQGNVQVLSSPRIATMNNQKAIIKVGEDEFFVTEVKNSQIVGSGGEIVNNPEIELTPFFSGIALDVTPQISADGFINLHIHPTISDVTEDTKVIVLEGSTQILPMAKSTIRESDSLVRARNGQVVVIGGLMQNDVTELVAGIPLLSQIPIVGALFRQTRQQSIKSELVILLRPTLVQDSNWNPYTLESAQRFDAVNQGFHLGSRPDIFGNLAEFKRYNKE